MHPRNIYRDKPNFLKISEDFPDLKKHLKFYDNGKVTLNFDDQDALRCLTKVLLKQDFGYEISIPENRLIPAIPQRLNYVLWIEDVIKCGLMKDSSPSYSYKGIDIGTGSCCIIPFLCCSSANWNFLATENDEISFHSAKSNILQNNMAEKIQRKLQYIQLQIFSHLKVQKYFPVHIIIYNLFCLLQLFLLQLFYITS